MNTSPCNVIVYYDGGSPSCVKDRQRFENLAGRAGSDVCWFDITEQPEQLREKNIDPQRALRELHVQTADGRIRSSIEAYILLFKRVPLLRPLAWLIGLPLIRPLLAKIYHWRVQRRLRRSGRL